MDQLANEQWAKGKGGGRLLLIGGGRGASGWRADGTGGTELRCRGQGVVAPDAWRSEPWYRAGVIVRGTSLSPPPSGLLTTLDRSQRLAAHRKLLGNPQKCLLGG